jgi:hypothetical protein
LISKEGAMKARALFAILMLGLVAAGTASAQETAPGDPRLTQQLDRMGIHYTITAEGNYSILYNLKGGRTQTVYIMGQTEKYRETEIRELWSRAGVFDAVPSAEVMQSLLEESGTSKIGFWSVEKSDEGGYIVYFSVKVPVYLKDPDLSGLLELTANVADEKEQELFNTDDE